MATGNSKFDGNVVVTDNLNCKSLTVREASITNAMVSAIAGIAATKIQKPRLKEYNQSGTAASVTIPLYVCEGATATVQNIKAGSIVLNIGAATVTVDLKKNGSSILTGVITLDTANTARVLEAGTLTSGALVVGDWLELVIVATVGGGTLATGLLVQCEIFEDQ